MDFSGLESTQGRTWRIAGSRDGCSKAEHPPHVSPTANQYDADRRDRAGLADYEQMFGHPLVDVCEVDPDTGDVLLVLTVVTDNGGPFRSLVFELFMMHHPALRHAHPGAFARAEPSPRSRVRGAETRAAVPRIPSCSSAGGRGG